LATYNKALQRYDSTFNWSQSILIVPTTNTLAQSHNKAKWLFIILALVINLLFLVAIRVPKLNQEVIKAQLEGQNTALQATLAELKAIVPGRENWLSSSMAALNVLVFLGVVILSGSLIAIPAEILLKFGGNLRQNVLSGEYWRLLSNTFLHGGLQHIVYNMFGLLVTGSLIELKLGKLRFLAIYFVSGLAASICSLVWHENTISIGASGAIMGLVGGLACLAAMRVLAPSEHASLLKLSLFYIVGAVFGLLDSGTDNAAHFGGLAAGFLVTLTIVLVVGREKLKSQMATLE
jgi:membrane associated rhomboid family serine protease